MVIHSEIFLIEIEGNSMFPLIREGDLLIMKKTKRFSLFDVVSFYDERIKRRVVHRLVSVKGRTLLTHGDNNSSILRLSASFEKNLRKDVSAKVIAIIRNGSMIKGWRFKFYSLISLFFATLKVFPYLLKELFLEPKKLFYCLF